MLLYIAPSAKSLEKPGWSTNSTPFFVCLLLAFFTCVFSILCISCRFILWSQREEEEGWIISSFVFLLQVLKRNNVCCEFLSTIFQWDCWTYWLRLSGAPSALFSNLWIRIPQTYSKPSQTSKMELFVKTIFAKKIHLRCLTNFLSKPLYSGNTNLWLISFSQKHSEKSN